MRVWWKHSRCTMRELLVSKERAALEVVEEEEVALEVVSEEASEEAEEE